jgi:hypothetical protein|tara:strand:- start:255 stop:410 length:156 start_codon:yes stop_codon:yes gene_type:complete
MSKKYSNAGKGDKSRITDKKKYSENWEKIFGKKDNVEKNKEKNNKPLSNDN